jgi:hypothetical protein
MVDRHGVLTGEQYLSGLRHLSGRGIEVVSSPLSHLPERNREIELIVPAPDPAETDRVAAACAAAFGMPVEVGVTTYISRGTDDDAHGVLRGFGIEGEVTRRSADGADVVTVALTADARRRVAESRLHTALEAALNCEVRIVSAP